MKVRRQDGREAWKEGGREGEKKGRKELGFRAVR